MSKHTHFEVDGKPFYSLGGQVHNASAYAVKDLVRAVKAVHAVGGNTIAIPVYWEIVEPQEGVFDFSLVGEIIEYCRAEDLRVVFLWFATWKNGTMKYSPVWVKEQPERFRRVLNQEGQPTTVLSSHCKANFEADKRAFEQLMTFIRDFDGQQKTVIGIQVENESGIIGDATRDFSELGDAAMAEPVPAQVIDFVAKHPEGWVYKVWQENGCKREGDWETVFGPFFGAEYMTAHSIATYIDAIAAAGRAIYDTVYYTNVWLDFNTWNVPGMSYPAGGACTRTLDIWKAVTPNIDFISPDNYKPDVETYHHLMATYARDDNPLHVPESGHTPANVRGMMRTIAEHDSIGNHIFGIERIFMNDGSFRPEMIPIRNTMRMISAALPLVNGYHGTGKIRAITQNAGMASRLVKLGAWEALVQFGKPVNMQATDYLHKGTDDGDHELGRALVFCVSDDEFYFVGQNMVLHFDRPVKQGRLNPLQMTDFTQTRSVNYSICTEGHFEGDTYVVDRHRDGDENDFGLWLTPDVGVVHVKLCD